MKSKHFRIYELVPKHIYNKFGENAWKFIDPRLIEMIDKLKEDFPSGSITINNYHWNGNRNWSGLRTPGSPYYSETSQHSFGRAVDCLFSKYDIEEVRQYIIASQDVYKYIKGIELDVSWLHIDVRNEDKLITFKV